MFCVCVLCMFVYIHIYIEREREREKWINLGECFCVGANSRAKRDNVKEIGEMSGKKLLFEIKNVYCLSVFLAMHASLLFLLSLILSCHQPPVNKPWQITLPDWSKAVGVVGAPDEVDSSTKFTKQHVKIKYGLDGVFFVMPPEQFVPTQQAGGAGGIAGPRAVRP